MTDDQIEAMRDMQHLHVTEAARRLGVHPSTARKWARRMGLTFSDAAAREAIARSSRRRRKVDPEVLAGLTHLTMIEAARELGVSHSTVHAWAARLGLTFPDGRGRSEAALAAAAKRRKIDPDCLRDLTHLCITEAAERLGVRPHLVSEWSAKLGLTFNAARGRARMAAAAREQAKRPRTSAQASASARPKRPYLAALAHLDDQQRADYRVLRKAQFSPVEALESVGRPDLAAQVAREVAA